MDTTIEVDKVVPLQCRFFQFIFCIKVVLSYFILGDSFEKSVTQNRVELENVLSYKFIKDEPCALVR